MDTLLICIQNETAAMVELVDVLQQEQAALIQAPTLALMEEIKILTQKKNQLVGLISILGQSRNNELFRLGFTFENTTITKWLKDKVQSECWMQLMEQTKKVDELNRINGLLITRHLARKQSTLDVLYRNYTYTYSNPVLFDANGQTGTQRNSVRGVVA